MMDELKDVKWMRYLLEEAAVYFVGGCVRDELIGIKSKDIDLLVVGMAYKDIANLLRGFGKVDYVGESFGVIKFTHDYITYDIAVPRKDSKASEGHKGFTISTTGVTLLDDLKRRDFTMNAIAKDVNTGEYIDPYGGVRDISCKRIRCVDETAFPEDPLRMLRAIQFASRLKFTIAPSTLKLIQVHRAKLEEISGERIAEELNKIVTKGDIQIAVDLFNETNLHTKFGNWKFIHVPLCTRHERKEFGSVKTLAEFLLLLYSTCSKGTATNVAKLLKVNTHSMYEIAILEDLYYDKLKNAKLRVYLFYAYKKLPRILQSELLKEVMGEMFALLTGRYPKQLSELNVTSEEMMNLGLTGPRLGIYYQYLVENIMDNTISNTNADIIHFINATIREKSTFAIAMDQATSRRRKSPYSGSGKIRSKNS